MFKFKKAMAGTQAQGNFECECCGSMENQNAQGCGCGSAAGTEMVEGGNSCCGPVNSSLEKSSMQMPGCVPCGTPADNGKQSSSACRCSSGGNSCC